MAQAGIGFDVVPIELEATSEILVEKVDLPSNIRQGQPFETRIVVNRFQQSGDPQRAVSGELRLLRSVGPREQEVFQKSCHAGQGRQCLSDYGYDRPAGRLHLSRRVRARCAQR